MRRVELMREDEPEGDEDMPKEEPPVKHRLRLTPDPDNPNSGQGTFTVDEGPRKLGKMHPHSGKTHRVGQNPTHPWWRTREEWKGGTEE